MRGAAVRTDENFSLDGENFSCELHNASYPGQRRFPAGIGGFFRRRRARLVDLTSISSFGKARAKTGSYMAVKGTAQRGK